MSQYTADNVPSHVPATHATRWANVWNTTYDTTLADGTMSREECESRAYQAANAMLSDRANAIKVGDSVIWRDDKGVRCRGKATGFVAGDSDKQTDGLDDDQPMLEVERWKPIRDGWVPSGQVVKIAAGDAHKTDLLWEPSKATRKGEDMVAVRHIGGAIKRLGDYRVGGYAIRWGDADHTDLEHDFFTKNTDIWSEFKQEIPLVFDHASGVELPPDPDWPEDEQDNPKRYVVGRIVKTYTDEIGHFVEAVLDAHNKWVDGVMQLVDKGALAFSSGSAPHLIKRLESGEIKSWKIVEVSMTPSPAQPNGTEVRAIRSADAEQVIDVSNSGTASPEARPDGAQAPAMSRSMRTINNDVKTNDLTRSNKRMRNIRRLNHLLSFNWDANLAATASSYASAYKAVKAEGDNPEDNQAVQDAASQLDQLVQPIAEQAKSALGIDVDEAKSMLLKACLQRIAKADMPNPEDEDYLEEGEPELLPDEEPMDEYVDAEELLAPPDDEEELPPAATMSTRSADISAVVRRELAKLGEGKGMNSVKSGLTIMVKNPANRDLTVSAVIKAYRDKDHATMRLYKTRNAAHYKALGLNPDSTGGFLVEPEYSQEYIELLRAKSIFMRTNAVEGSGVGDSLITTMPMTTDTMYIPTQTGAATANWIGENVQIPESQQAFGQRQLVARKLSARVLVSNELLDDASSDVDAFIRDDVTQQIAVAVDDGILYGDGIGAHPRGAWYTVGVGNAPLNAVPAYGDLTAVTTRLELHNVPEDNSWRWIFNPRAKEVIRGIQDGAGQYIFTGDAMTAGTQPYPQMLLGYPWISSNTVHRVVGPPEEFDIFFGRWKDIVLGLRKSIEIVASDVAGTTFENDQTAIRAIMRLDVTMRHAESVEILSQVRSS